jgi:membrane protein
VTDQAVRRTEDTPAGAGGRGWLGRVRDRARRIRRRNRIVDHVARAALRYDRVNGARLAAAVTYYQFLAVFPLAAVALSVLGYLLAGSATMRAEVEQALLANLPGLPVESISEVRGVAGLIGAIGFVLAGLGWVNSVRGSVRRMWGVEETPGNLFFARVIDFGVLLALGCVLGASVWLSFGAASAVRWLFDLVGFGDSQPGDTVAAVLAGLLAGLINLVYFVALLTGLPRLRLTFRQVLGPALVGSAGMEVLKTAGRIYVNHTNTNPVYQTVVVAVGLLVFLDWLNQLLLFCAALTATSRHRQPLNGELAGEPARRELASGDIPRQEATGTAQGAETIPEA